MNDAQIRQAVAEASINTVRQGLNRGSSGNVSARCDEGFLITPSGLPSDTIQANQVVRMSMNGHWQGDLRPSSEWRIHRDIYQARPGVGAVVHMHSPFAASLSCMRRSVPPFHYMIAIIGGKSIPCANYALFGTPALSDAVLQALDDQLKACLMANHGLVAVGDSLRQALAIAVEVESLCEQYWRACQMGQPVLLDDDEMDAVLLAFKDYVK